MGQRCEGVNCQRVANNVCEVRAENEALKQEVERLKSLQHTEALPLIVKSFLELHRVIEKNQETEVTIAELNKRLLNLIQDQGDLRKLNTEEEL